MDPLHLGKKAATTFVARCYIGQPTMSAWPKKRPNCIIDVPYVESDLKIGINAPKNIRRHLSNYIRWAKPKSVSIAQKRSKCIHRWALRRIRYQNWNQCQKTYMPSRSLEKAPKDTHYLGKTRRIVGKTMTTTTTKHDFNYK